MQNFHGYIITAGQFCRSGCTAGQFCRSATVCCRCNASGRCRNCSCRKSGRSCVDCLPHRHSRCQIALPLQQSSDSAGHAPSSDPQNTDPDAPEPADLESPVISEPRENVHHPSRCDNVLSIYCPPNITSPPDSIAPSPALEGPAVDTLDNSVYPYSQAHEPIFMWGIHDGTTFDHSLTCCYAEVVHWKRNLFKIPSGKAGNSFVKEITRLLRAYTEASALESVALKAVMVMPHLLLQKSHRTSKAKDHVAQLERRLETWANGDLDQLLHEGRTIQKQLSSGPNKTPSHDAKVAQRFSKLMMEGKVKAALRLITDQERGGLLPLDSVASSEGTTTKTVRDILLEKHPSAQPPFPSAICEPSETIYEL